MLRRNSQRGFVLAAGLLALVGCNPAPADELAAPTDSAAPLGLMTSLPLYWGEGADVADLAAGRGGVPWQRAALETRYAIRPLDTLSPVPALSPDAPDSDPLAGLTRLAVIQPRGLSPSDNVALDRWVRGGGRLLLALDPALTGAYDLPLGDPRRPVDAALIPPVVERWGLAVSFDEGQTPVVTYVPLSETTEVGAGGGARPVPFPLALAGRIALDAATADCVLQADAAMAVCRVGRGRVTLIADAALFEHAELAGTDGAGLLAVMAAAFE
jgi:hypothetical protein